MCIRDRFYIVLAIGVILLNLNRIPSVFVSILEGAFRPSAVTGGIVGSMLMSVKKGVSRGIFSNEAGLGTGSIAHACACLLYTSLPARICSASAEKKSA